MTDTVLGNGGKAEIQRALDALSQEGGGVSDPLDIGVVNISSRLALAEDAPLQSHVNADATAGMDQGDQPLIRLHRFSGTEEGTGGSWDAIVIGSLFGEEAPLNDGYLVYDPWEDGSLSTNQAIFLYGQGDYNHIYDNTDDDPYMSEYVRIRSNSIYAQGRQPRYPGDQVGTAPYRAMYTYYWPSTAPSRKSIGITEGFPIDDLENELWHYAIQGPYGDIFKYNQDGLYSFPGRVIQEHQAQAQLFASSTITDGDTITLNGTVYTFRDTPTVTGDIQIAVDFNDTYLNLATATIDGDDFNEPNPDIFFNGIYQAVAVNPGPDGNALTVDASFAVSSGGGDSKWYVDNSYQTLTSHLVGGTFRHVYGLALGESAGNPASEGLLRFPFGEGAHWRGFNDDGDLKLFTVHSNYDGENALLLAGSDINRHTSFIISSLFNAVDDWMGVTFTAIDNLAGGTYFEQELVDHLGNGVNGSQVFAAGTGQQARLEISYNGIAAGYVLRNLPVADPTSAGSIWEWTGDITALTNYLAAGGRLMALGNPS